MTHQDFMAFERLVREMRAAQKAFFRVKSHTNLLAARTLEHEVDKMLLREGTLPMFPDHTPEHLIGWPDLAERREDGHNLD